MDTNLILLWLVVAACVLNAKAVIQAARAGRPGFLFVLGGVLAVSGVGWLLRFPFTGALAATLFALLVILPGLVQRRMWRLAGAFQYEAAVPYARAVAILHPANGFPLMPALLRALALAQRGELVQAEVQLAAIAEGPSNPVRSDAASHLCRIRGDWAGYLARTAQLTDAALDSDLGALIGRLRALGETGQLDALVGLFARHELRLRTTAAEAARVHAQLLLFAFTGRRAPLERLLAAASARLPAATAQRWRETCAFASANAALSAESQRKLDELERDQQHDVRYADHARLKQAHLTLALLALNVLAFAAEELLGGSEDGATLYRLGALVTGEHAPAEPYRLLTALFLHFGVMHLAMNMLNLALIGPFVETSLGKLRTGVVYFASGLAGSLLVSKIPQAELGLFLGASGCIMGLLGATAGILFHGYRKHRARPALHRLRNLAVPLSLQLAFDLSIPGISLTAHWTGVFVGFVLATLLAGGHRGERLAAPRR